MSAVATQVQQKKPVPAHYGRPRRAKAAAWSVKSILAKTVEERGKYSQEAWQELEVEMRTKLRQALRAVPTDKKSKGRPGENDSSPERNSKSSREIKDLALAAGICQSKAYPDQANSGLGAHVPAKLLQTIAARLERGRSIPVDITPEPQAVVVETVQPINVSTDAS